MHVKIKKDLGEKGHTRGKNFVNKNKIKCKWCHENPATAAAHVIGKAHKNQFLSTLSDKKTYYAGEVIPDDYISQMSPNVIVGITCPTCDNFIANNYEIKKDWREIQATLWKIAGAIYFSQFEDPNSKVSQREMITTPRAPTNPTKKETKRVMKHFKKGLLNNNRTFHTMDLTSYTLSWGFQETVDTDLSGILNKNLTSRYIYLHTGIELHYLPTDLKKLNSYTIIREMDNHNNNYPIIEGYNERT